MTRPIEGSIAVVTGASRGIGRAVAIALAQRGANVWGAARQSDALDELESHGVTTYPLDVTDADSVADFADAIVGANGRIDILVNNAGVLGPRGPLADVSFEQWSHTIDVNLHGVFRVTMALEDALAEGGIVINVSSSVGRKGRGGWGPYAVSKHGVEGFSGTLADELESRGVTVVSLNPGGTATDMRAEAYPDEDPATLPTAEKVAGTFVRVIEDVGLEQTGAQLNSRDLFDA